MSVPPQSANASRAASAETAGADITFQTGVYDNSNWDDQFGTYHGDAIPDQQVAVNVASQIYEGMEKSSEEKDYVPQYVFFDEQSEVWIVSFWPEWSETDEIILGGECNIALRKADGKVMRIWYTE